MRRTQWILTVAIVLGVAGCSTHAGTAPTEELPLLTATVLASAAPPEWSAPPTGPPAEPQPADPPPGLATSRSQPGESKPFIQKTVRSVARSATAAAVVIDRDTGATLVSENADRQFAAGSLVKLLIGSDALLRHPEDAVVRRNVTTMIKTSDDHIASTFWASEGGPLIVSRMRDHMGLRSTEPPRPPNRWGNTLITADDVAAVYDYLLTRATTVEQKIIVEAMSEATTTGADGFKQHFGIPSGIRRPWAVKQAWATDQADRKAVHSTGLVGRNWRHVVVLLTEHSPRETWNTASSSVTEAALAIAPRLD